MPGTTTARSVPRSEVPLSYAAVGATQAEDLLYFPPKGFHPMERRARLGSGTERFEVASAKLMAWGVQRGAGITVGDIQPAGPSTTDYAGLVFDESGTPVGPRAAHPEQGYGEDGTPLVSAGTTAELTVRAFGLRFRAPIRVVYLVNEPGRIGFAYGTLPGHPESGEESFVVEHLSDDSVWIVVRAFSRPSTWFYRLGLPVLRIVQARATRRYLRALMPSKGA
ncbi:DUF1990 domain-containing protein [Herbiconiux sp. CPCC 205763]|uniref:DUF1990 domain-containing protein n=1 Tax=Herbiconiux aconitum TaxID=2970913 RepID=A0ABT2GZE5_9MICO|nr:DUF1990 domain-containing protein [Herbiconiux aconitum]MCS5720304.1 DUF1990 domain-containing protein [Herbiconiux aconitum]